MSEEMKRPTSHISQNSIKPALSKAVEFYTDNNRQAYECIRERDEYIDYLESKLSNAKPQQDLPVVPECVAEWIEYVKGKDNNVTALLTDFDNMPEDVDGWLFLQSNDDNINLILRAWLDGYTVEKPQLLYLENKITGMYLSSDGKEFYEHHKIHGFKFTQAEIDSMETGSYEPVPVEDGE